MTYTLRVLRLPGLEEDERATYLDLETAKKADIFGVYFGKPCVVTITEDQTGKVVYNRQIASSLPTDLG